MAALAVHEEHGESALAGEPSKSLDAALRGTMLLSFAADRLVVGMSGAFGRRHSARLGGLFTAPFQEPSTTTLPTAPSRWP
jgi:hypothetical protein